MGRAYLRMGSAPKRRPAKTDMTRREQKHRCVDADGVEPRKAFRLEAHQQAQSRRGEAEPQNTSHGGERQAFSEKLTRQPFPVRSHRRSDRNLLLFAVGAHEKKVRDIGACDEKHEPHSAEEHPQNVSHVANHVLFERPDIRAEADIPQVLEAHPFRELLHHQGDHPVDVGIGAQYGLARSQSRKRLKAEIADIDFGAIEAERKPDVRVEAQKAKLGGHDADNLARPAIDHDRLADDAGLPAHAALPIAMPENHRLGAIGVIVLGREATADGRLHSQNREGPVGDIHRLHLFGLLEPGDRDRALVPHADVFESGAFLAISEVSGRRLIQSLGEAEAFVPRADETIRLLERQRLQ